MSDGITEARRGTYFKDRSELPFGYTFEKETSIKPTFWRRIFNKFKRHGTI
jgi:hypothetical protein